MYIGTRGAHEALASSRAGLRHRRFGTTGYLLRGLLLLSVVVGTFATGGTTMRAATAYDNPIPLQGGGFRFQSCPDPAVIRGQTPGDNYWYLYCTTDPRDSLDTNARGSLNFRFIPIFRSLDLVNWAYVGDVFMSRPAFVAENGYLWAPEVKYFNNRYYLYYTASETNLPGGGSAIGVATSTSPTGPWTVRNTAVVEPQAFGGGRRWVYDPAIVTDAAAGRRYLFYGSFFGGISARLLSEDGFSTDPASETPIALPNRYEGSAVMQKDGYYYLFVSATNCCNGPLTGYSVFAGRSVNALGPYRDRDNVSFLDARTGGTPVLSQNGNRWVGPGHNTVFTDFAGRDWAFYHAVDRFDPYFAAYPGFTKRPLLLDPVEWRDGWPSVRGIRGPSDEAQPGPAAQPGESPASPLMRTPEEAVLGPLVPGLSDEFAPGALRPQWQWMREPGYPNAYGLTDGTFRFATIPGELYGDTDTASMLTEAAPNADYTVETRMRFDIPTGGDTYNFLQAGLVIYWDDDNYVKLVHVAISETRQIEFAKEQFPVPANYPRYGNAVLGPPGEWTWLRITKRNRGGEEEYTAYSSRDGARWQRGATWTHALGGNARIGLVSMGAASFPSGVTANFDYVRVYSTANFDPVPSRPGVGGAANIAPAPPPRASSGGQSPLVPMIAPTVPPAPPLPAAPRMPTRAAAPAPVAPAQATQAIAPAPPRR